MGFLAIDRNSSLSGVSKSAKALAWQILSDSLAVGIPIALGQCMGKRKVGLEESLALSPPALLSSRDDVDDLKRAY